MKAYVNAYTYHTPTREKIIEALEAASARMKHASMAEFQMGNYGYEQAFDKCLEKVEAALEAMEIEDGDATDEQLRRLVRTDEGDSKVMHLPDGTTRFTGFTAESGSDPDEYAATLRRIYDEWRGL
jgi:hypothetical protein